MQRLSADISIAGFMWFTIAVGTIQAMHPDQLAAEPISAYLRGPDSPWTQSAYYILAVSLALLGFSIFASRPPRLHIAASILLWIAACAVTVVAYSYTSGPLPGQPGPGARETIHVLNAFVAFLTITIVMFIETPLLWRGATRRRVVAFAVGVFIIELAATLGPDYTPGFYGALEKLSIIGLIMWLIAAASRLRTVAARN